MSPTQKFILTSVLVAGSMLAGFLARRLLRLPETVAHKAMWFVVVAGYPSVGLVSVWRISLRPEHAWLPVLALVFITGLTFLSLGTARLLRCERPLEGLFGIAGGLGNTGFTMGAFLCYQFFGPEGLGLAAVHDLAWSVLIVFLMYPIARRYSERDPMRGSLRMLIWRSLWDVRSMSLAATLAGVGLNLTRVPVPGTLLQVRFVEIMMFTTATLAYFSIGLRLHVGHVRESLRLIVALGAVRFLAGPAIGVGLVGLTYLVGIPLTGTARGVFHVETCVPTAVTMVAIANLFHLRPREASAMFVVNTLSYLAICVPVLVWINARFWQGW